MIIIYLLLLLVAGSRIVSCDNQRSASDWLQMLENSHNNQDNNNNDENQSNQPVQSNNYIEQSSRTLLFQPTTPDDYAYSSLFYQQNYNKPLISNLNLADNKTPITPLLLVIDNDITDTVNITYRVQFSIPQQALIKQHRFTFLSSNSLPNWLTYIPATDSAATTVDSADYFTISIDPKSIPAATAEERIQLVVSFEGWIEYEYGLINSANSTQSAAIFLQISSPTGQNTLTSSFNVINNPRTDRTLLTSSSSSSSAIHFSGKQDISLKAGSICVDSVNILDCIFPISSWLNIESGTVKVAGSLSILGYLEIQQNAVLNFDLGSSDSIALIESRAEENDQIIPITNNGMIRISSGHVILRCPMIGRGSIEVNGNGVLELQNYGTSEYLFNNTVIQQNMDESTGEIVKTVQSKPVVNILAGVIIFDSGEFHFTSPLTLDSASRIIISPTATLLLDSNNDLPATSSIVTHHFHPELFLNTGSISILNSTLNCSTSLFQSSGPSLLNITEFGQFFLYLNDLDHNLITNYYSETGLISVFNSGVFALIRGKLNILSGFHSENSAHTMISTNTIRQAHLIFNITNNHNNNKQNRQISSSNSNNNGDLIAIENDIMIGGIEFINNGELSVVSGIMYLTTPLIQLTGGKLNLINSNSQLQLTSNYDSVFSVCLLFTDCPSIAVENGAKFHISAGSGLLLLPNSTAEISNLQNEGRITLSPGSTVKVDYYLQQENSGRISMSNGDSISSSTSLYLSDEANFIAPINNNNANNPECIFNAGKISGNGNLFCPAMKFGHIDLDLTNSWIEQVTALKNNANNNNNNFILLSQSTPISLLLTPDQTNRSTTNSTSTFRLDNPLELSSSSSVNFHISSLNSYTSLSSLSPCNIHSTLNLYGTIELDSNNGMNSSTIRLIECIPLQLSLHSIVLDNFNCVNCVAELTNNSSMLLLQLRYSPTRHASSSTTSYNPTLPLRFSVLLMLACFLFIVMIY